MFNKVYIIFILICCICIALFFIKTCSWSDNIFIGSAEERTIRLKNSERYPLYDEIRNEIKTVIGLPTIDGQKYKIGDMIILTATAREPMSVRIVDIVSYPSLEIFLHSEGVREIIPRAKTLHEALDLHKKWYPNVQSSWIALHIKPI